MEGLICDSAPLVAAADRRDRAHQFAAALVTVLGRQLIVPDPVIVEVDYLLRRRVGVESARLFLTSMDIGEHTSGFLSPGLLRRAIEFDARYADLDLGFTDGAVMAFAERHHLPILTFDFAHFRATQSEQGPWKLVVDEARYRDVVRG